MNDEMKEIAFRAALDAARNAIEAQALSADEAALAVAEAAKKAYAALNPRDS